MKKSALLLLVPAVALSMGASDCGDLDEGGKDTGLDRQTTVTVTEGEDAGDTAAPSTFKPRHFSGNGSTNIGTINVPVDAVLEWTNTGGGQFAYFSAYDAGFNLNIDSEAAQGSSVMPPGTYKNIAVTGDDWAITIRPAQ